MNGDTIQAELAFPNVAVAQQLFGAHNRHLKLLGERLGVQINSFGNGVRIGGEMSKVSKAQAALQELYDLIGQGHPIGEAEVRGAADHYVNGDAGKVEDQYRGSAAIQVGARKIIPKNAAQKRYVEAIRTNTVTLAIGPAGTGKTYLAVAAALEQLTKRMCKKIIVSRPVVEAGEKLGFLPGDLFQKIDPYLRPIYDAIEDITDIDRMREMIDKGAIEIAPLAYMRGRTLTNTFVILDEAQNTTQGQMKMFLTRLGSDSRMVISGDITQVDLPDRKQSGLAHAIRILEGIKGIGIERFDAKDVIRHRIVTEIVNAYETESQLSLPLGAAPRSDPGSQT